MTAIVTFRPSGSGTTPVTEPVNGPTSAITQPREHGQDDDRDPHADDRDPVGLRRRRRLEPERVAALAHRFRDRDRGAAPDAAVGGLLGGAGGGRGREGHRCADGDTDATPGPACLRWTDGHAGHRYTPDRARHPGRRPRLAGRLAQARRGALRRGPRDREHGPRGRLGPLARRARGPVPQPPPVPRPPGVARRVPRHALAVRRPPPLRGPRGPAGRRARVRRRARDRPPQQRRGHAGLRPGRGA